MSNPHWENESGLKMAAPAEEPQEIIIPKKVVFGVLSLVVLLFSVFTGLINCGYESRSIRFYGIGSTSRGYALGFKTMYLREGQTLVVDYETDIETGALGIRLSTVMQGFRTPPEQRTRVKDSGAGEFRIEILKTGPYRLEFYGSPDGDGYDLSYSASWRIE